MRRGSPWRLLAEGLCATETEAQKAVEEETAGGQQADLSRDVLGFCCLFFLIYFGCVLASSVFSELRTFSLPGVCAGSLLHLPTACQRHLRGLRAAFCIGHNKPTVLGPCGSWGERGWWQRARRGRDAGHQMPHSWGSTGASCTDVTAGPLWEKWLFSSSEQPSAAPPAAYSGAWWP